MSRREQLVDDAAEVAALLEDVDEPEPTPARTSVRAAATLVHHDASDLAAMLALDDAMTAGAALCQAYDRREQAAGRLAEHVLSYAVPAPLVEAFAGCGCTGTGLRTCPGRDDDAVTDARRAREALCEAEPEACRVAGAYGVPHPHVPTEQPEHVHDVGPAWDEDGTPYAHCATCGHRWDRQPCDICGLPVTGLVIAQDGRARHRHHRPEAS